MEIQTIATAFLVSVLLTGVAFWRRWLDRSGVAAALVVGTLTLGFGGWAWAILLGLFFISSSLLSRFKAGEKLATSAEKFDKGSRRDWGQVLANGGIGSLVAVLSGIVPIAGWYPFFVGVMATVTADTWATEIGTLAQRSPRLITNGRKVERGTSGGITPLGTGATFMGGLLIGLVAGLLTDAAWWRLALAGAAGGLAGSLTDSVLGATVQAIYFSDARAKETEQRLEKDGTPNRLLRGWRWLSNDWVNALSSLVGGAVAWLVMLN